MVLLAPGVLALVPMSSLAAVLVYIGIKLLNIPEVIAAAEPETLEWLVVEFDKCDTDMMAAVRDSYQFMTDNALGAGNV